jgi:hypothetical protein
MDECHIKDSLYGSLVKLFDDEKYYYPWGQGPTGTYTGSLTDEGLEAVKLILNIYAPVVKNFNKDQLDQRAKELVVEELKKENK